VRASAARIIVVASDQTPQRRVAKCRTILQLARAARIGRWRPDLTIASSRATLAT
jgi:hypothetical protein